MLKLALLLSATLESLALLTRIRPWVAAGAVTVQLCAPSLGVLLKRVVHETPPLRDSSIFTFPPAQLDVQRIVCTLPTLHVSPPFGAVTVRLPPPIPKFTSLVSETLGSFTSLTRIRARAVAGAFTFQLYDPSLGVLLIRVAQVEPPSLDSSIFTLSHIWLEVQAIVWVLPRGQVSPPFGTLTLMLPPPSLKFASLVSRTPESFTPLTRIRACVVAGGVTFQLYTPSLAVLPTRVTQEAPASRDASIFTLPQIWVEVHRIDSLQPMGQASPPFGAVTVRLPPPSMKFESLLSSTLGSFTLLTRIRPWAVAGAVTVQGWVPSFGVLPTRVVQEVPPSREISIFT